MQVVGEQVVPECCKGLTCHELPVHFLKLVLVKQNPAAIDEIEVLETLPGEVVHIRRVGFGSVDCCLCGLADAAVVRSGKLGDLPSMVEYKLINDIGRFFRSGPRFLLGHSKMVGKATHKSGDTPLATRTVDVWDELVVAGVSFASGEDSNGVPSSLFLRVHQEKVGGRNATGVDGLVARGRALLERNDGNTVGTTKQLVEQHDKVSKLVVVNMDEQRSLRVHEPMDNG